MPHSADLSVVRVANTPTEAQLLRNVLQAADIPSYVNDANLLQANSFLTGAIGGVKLMVASVDLERAQQVLRDWDGGEFVLEGERMDAPPQYKTVDRPLFSPEAAFVCSLLVSPALGAAIEIANLKSMNRTEGRSLAWFVFVAMLLVTLATTAFMIYIGCGFLSGFSASLALSFFSVSLYMLFGREHSRLLIDEYGIRYPRRSLFRITVLIAAFTAGFSGLLSYLIE